MVIRRLCYCDREDEINYNRVRGLGGQLVPTNIENVINIITFNALIIFVAEHYNIFKDLTEHKFFIRFPRSFTTRIRFLDVIII